MCILVPPSISEQETDANANIRKRICQDITNNEYFSLQGMDPVDMDSPTTLRELRRRKYVDVFDQLFEWSNSTGVERYSNLYVLRDFQIDEGTVGRRRRAYRSILPVQEYVFVCLVKKPRFNSILWYYISKEFEISTLGAYERINARFVFEADKKIQRLTLAEEPAKAYVSPDYDIEFIYLQIRENNRRGKLIG